MLLDLFQSNSSHKTQKIELLFAAADSVLGMLTSRQSVSAKALQEIMTRVFGATDAAGAWNWKDSYEVLEIALARFLQKYGDTIRNLRGQPVLTLLDNLQNLCPTHTKRSDESQKLQQFSTPVGIGYIAASAAGLVAGDVMLEPSAGTGLLAVMSRIWNTGLVLNELADDRRAILARLFPQAPLSGHNAEYINDYLDAKLQPTVVLMNPPFSASPNAAGASPEATLKHLLAALRLLPEGGRLVTITGENFTPFSAKWRTAFVNLQHEATVCFSAGIDGKMYAKQGTTIPTRLTVIDRVPAGNPEQFSCYHETAESLTTLYSLVQAHVPTRLNSTTPPATAQVITISSAARPAAQVIAPVCNAEAERQAVELEYFTKDWLGDDTAMATGIYESYTPQTIVIPGAKAHPSPLVQSAAMASIAGPKPTYRPHIYPEILSDGILSDAQLESVILAGEAHNQYLKGYFIFDENSGIISRAAADQEGAVEYRRGWYLGDGTGCGKGRQVAGILLDNWLKGRKRGIWISKNDKLLEDAQRDWTALGGKDSQIIPQWNTKLGADITLSEGILFTTYATLRGAGRGEKVSRLEQIINWLGKDFDGCIMFDEAHAMANAVSSKGNRGVKKASAQGLAGVELQNALPDARVVYVSATGATSVSNLAYAARLGLWQTDDMPFTSQHDFINAMEKGGIAAMEIISRDLKSLGLYTARSLSYEGVEYEFLEHELTDEQIRIYDTYAEAFQVIHQNIESALDAVNINKANGKARNGMAKAAIRSAFESNKQRFFCHLITSMKCPSLIKAIQRDMDAGHSSVIQIVSTSEALMERRLAEIPVSEWGDLNVDITPREYVLDYLMGGFPIHLHEIFEDEKGVERTRPAMDDDGNRVVSRAAVAMRDALVEKLASLPAVPSALDQIIHHFAHDKVAEVTGRGRRVVRTVEKGRDRLSVQNRPASANLTETHAFMNDEKRILVFSDAGGTGRSYHADKNAKNKRLRRHYLLESGFKADTAVQGLGRTNRTNQEQPPVFSPVATNVKGEKRFISTIARRLDTLGAITKGQRETGGQGLFREADNLESNYARNALRGLVRAVYEGKIACCSLQLFEDSTGLSLVNEDEGGFTDDLPPIHTFLNRVLALPIRLQNDLFEEFEQRLVSLIERAKEAGTFETGVETLIAEGFTVLDRQVLYAHPVTGSETICSKIERRDRTQVLSLESAISLARKEKGKFIINESSGHAAVVVPTYSLVNEDGSIEERLRLVRPLRSTKIAVEDFKDSGWKPVEESVFSRVWQEAVFAAPEFTASYFYLITGILLPVWQKLPAEQAHVRRLQTDDGQKLLGRVVEPHEIEALLEKFELTSTAPAFSSAEILDMVVRHRKSQQLTNGLQIRTSLIMGEQRIEIIGFREEQKDQLKALGCMAEIIQYKLRLFVPANDNAASIIEQLRAVA